MVRICGYAYIFTVPSPLPGCPDLVRQPVLVQTCLILMSYTGESQPNIGEIYRFRARNYYLYMIICLYIYRACSFSVCVAVLLTLILTLCLRSSLLQSQTANLVTLPNLTARPVPILRQNVMPILLTSVITSTPRKTNNTSIIKGEPPSSNPGYDYGIYPYKLFLLCREN